MARLLGVSPRPAQPTEIKNPGLRSCEVPASGAGYHLRQNKKPTTSASAADHRLRLSGSGSIFTIDVFLHRLQYTGRSAALVLGSSLSGSFVAQYGHTILSPAVTNSISRFASICNTFLPLYR